MSNLNDVCDCCGGYEDQAILQLFDDKCFKIVEDGTTGEDFCLGDFAFPVDGNTCLKLNVDSSGGEVLIFDNALDPFNTAPLESGKLYARGALIRIIYPINDDDGEEITYVQKSVKISVQNAITFADTEYPFHDVFIMFTNAKSNVQTDLINRIKVINPNTNFKIRVSALVVLGKAT